MLWFLIGFAFIVVELLMLPAFILIFFGLGAWVTAVVVYFADLSLAGAIVVFLISSLTLLLLLRKWSMRIFKGKVDEGAQDGLNEPLAGKTVLVTKAIGINSGGEIKFRGSFWPAVADQPIEAGARALIIGHPQQDKTRFLVEPADVA